MSWFHGIFMSLGGMLIQIERRDDDAVVIPGSFQMIISSFCVSDFDVQLVCGQQGKVGVRWVLKGLL